MYSYAAAMRNFLGRRIWTLSAFLVASALSVTGAAGQPADTLASIKDRGTFVIGSDIPYGVMEFFDETGAPTGIDIDLAKRVAASLDAELEVSTMPFDALFDALDAGKIDVIVSAVTITQERQESMLFSVPYMDAGMSIAVAAGNTEISGKGDLKGKRVGVLKGTVGEELMQGSEFVDQDLLMSYESNSDRLADLVSGKLDAVIVHFLSDAVPGLKIIEPPLTQSFYGIVARLGDDALMEQINSVLRDMQRNGEIRRIMRSYLE